MVNEKLKFKIFKSDVYQYEIAEKLGISRFKLNRLLQTQITKEQEDLILNTLTELETEKKLTQAVI